MAELKKVQEYPYDLPEVVDQPEQQLPDSNQEIVRPQSPAKRLKHISVLEKLAVVSIIFMMALGLSRYYYDNVEYVCPNCGDIFIPSFLTFNLAPHTPKFRKLTCPKCGKRSYCLEISRE